MVGQFRLQRSLQDCFGELFQEAVLADDVFRLLVIGQQLVYQCLVDCHRFPFSSSDGRLHSSFYTLRPFSKRLASVSAILIGNGAGRAACSSPTRIKINRYLSTGGGLFHAYSLLWQLIPRTRIPSASASTRRTARLWRPGHSLNAVRGRRRHPTDAASRTS